MLNKAHNMLELAFAGLLSAAYSDEIEDAHIRQYMFYGDDWVCGSSFKPTHAPGIVIARFCTDPPQLFDYVASVAPLKKTTIAVSADLSAELRREGSALIHRAPSGQETVVDDAASQERAFLSADGTRVLWTTANKSVLPIGVDWGTLEWNAASGQMEVVASWRAITAASEDLTVVALRPALISAPWFVRDRSSGQQIEFGSLYTSQVDSISPDGTWFVQKASAAAGAWSRALVHFPTATSTPLGARSEPVFRWDSMQIAYAVDGAEQYTIEVRDLSSGEARRPDVGRSRATPSAFNERWLAAGASIIDLDAVQVDSFE